MLNGASSFALIPPLRPAPTPPVPASSCEQRVLNAFHTHYNGLLVNFIAGVDASDIHTREHPAKFASAGAQTGSLQTPQLWFDLLKFTLKLQESTQRSNLKIIDLKRSKLHLKERGDRYKLKLDQFKAKKALPRKKPNWWRRLLGKEKQT